MFNISFPEFEPAGRGVEIRIDLVIQSDKAGGEGEQPVFQLFYVLYPCLEFDVSERHTAKILKYVVYLETNSLCTYKSF